MPAGASAGSGPETPELTGLVLAGGGGKRMGRDKALLPLGNRPAVVVLAERLATCCSEVLVASGDGRRLAGLGLPEVADAAPAAGPLAGIVAGLERSSSPLLAVVAVDMVFADPCLLVWLARRHRGEAAVLASAGGRPQPLHGVWAKSAAAPLRRRLERGARSVSGAATELGAAVVDEREWRGAGIADGWADDADDPVGWQAALDRLGSPRR